MGICQTEHIASKELHLHEGRASGLLTLVELADSMTKLTMHRMSTVAIHVIYSGALLPRSL